MRTYLSDSAKKRLPVAITELAEKEQVTFTLLRMRRNDIFIARELGISLNEVGRLIENVQTALAKTGTLDLICDPVFYPIDHPQDPYDPDGRPCELADTRLDVIDQVALEQFYRILKKSINQLPKDSQRLLRLWFNKEMPAKDIFQFYKNIGVDLSEGKPIADTTVSDVFYILEKNLKNLVDLVRTNLNEKESDITPALIKDILRNTGI